MPVFICELRPAELRLDECGAISDAAICAVAESCSNLTGLSLGSCSGISDRTLEALSKCQQLKFLNISWCTLCSDDGQALLMKNLIIFN